MDQSLINKPRRMKPCEKEVEEGNKMVSHLYAHTLGSFVLVARAIAHALQFNMSRLLISIWVSGAKTMWLLTENT